MFCCNDFWIITLIILLIVYILRKSKHLIIPSICRDIYHYPSNNLLAGISPYYPQHFYIYVFWGSRNSLFFACRDAGEKLLKRLALLSTCTESEDSSCPPLLPRHAFTVDHLPHNHYFKLCVLMQRQK